MLLQSGCKINVGLRVVGKRADAYHNIESLFVPIPFFDTIEIVRAEVENFTVYNADFNIPKEKNLIWQCYKIMQAKYNLPPLQIYLVKRIPSGGGIGGGSGNVATFIKAINSKFNLQLAVSSMEAIALSIGSDCPFFIENKAAMVLGRGDVLLPYFNNNRKFYAVLLYSDVQISTKEAYSGISINDTNAGVLELLGDEKLWKKNLKNDFAPVVYAKYPELANLENDLYKQGAIYASLTGTGGCQYALFNTEVNLSPELQNKVLWGGWLSF